MAHGIALVNSFVFDPIHVRTVVTVLLFLVIIMQKMAGFFGMIAYVEGMVRGVGQAQLLVVAQGLGYEIECPSRVLHGMSEGSVVSLWVHQIIREDANDLYGFLNPRDRDAFRLMLRAPQVGPKLSLAILDAFTAGQLARIGSSGEARDLVQVKGLGMKLAERLIVDLKSWSNRGLLVFDAQEEASPLVGEHSKDVMGVLLQLGYKEAHVRRVLKDLPLGPVEEQIRYALKQLSGQGL